MQYQEAKEIYYIIFFGFMHHQTFAFVTGHMRATGDVVGEAPPAAGKLLFLHYLCKFK